LASAGLGDDDYVAGGERVRVRVRVTRCKEEPLA
jgi:hypothetical protein